VASIAFFLAGRSRVIVTMPSWRVTCKVSMRGDDTDPMGFNPHRRRVARRTDIVFVASAVLACVGLVLWTLLG